MTESPDAETLVPAQPKHHPNRWRLARAGIVNVWHYYDTVFRFTGGRMILRGTNGSGKSRALEMLLPFLLDADRRKMDATGSGKVRLEDLMRHGAQGQTNRLGYLWLELCRDIGGPEEHLTVGALVRFSTSTSEAKAWYFTTPLRVGVDLHLMDERRQPLSREHLTQGIGADRITDKPDTHRERIASQVFGLTGTSGKERYAGLLQLLHTLRAPDMGNRIDEGNLPKILSDALPPLSEVTLREAGERLDALADSREEQRRLLSAVEQIDAFLDVYRRYTSGALFATAEKTRGAASEATRLAKEHDTAVHRHAEFVARHTTTCGELDTASEREETLQSVIEGIKELPAYRAGLDIRILGRSVAALASAATTALKAAHDRREDEAGAVRSADTAAEGVHAEVELADAELSRVREALATARLPTTALPTAVHASVEPPSGGNEAVRVSLDGPVTEVERPMPRRLVVAPDELDEVVLVVRETGRSADRRAGEAARREQDATSLDARAREVTQLVKHAEELDSRATDDAERAQDAADDRDGTARTLATEWRTWTSGEQSRKLLGDVSWRETAVGPLLIDADALVGERSDDDLAPLDHVANDAALPARAAVADRLAELRQEQRADDNIARELRLEQSELRAQRDPEPPVAPWVRGTPVGGVPLWRLVEFSAELADHDRAGVEAALMSAGMLSASVGGDSSVRADNGQVLLTSEAAVAPRSIEGVLRPDPAGLLPEQTVKSVLSRIGLGPGHHVWVDVDGSWAAGPLRGKHRVDHPRFIGAVARARARDERLEAIAAELEELTRRTGERDDERKRLSQVTEDLNRHAHTAPRTNDLLRARSIARSAAAEAGRSQVAAAAAHQTARLKQEQWAADRRGHEKSCARLGLPADRAQLDEVKVGASRARHTCDRLADRLDSVRRRRHEHQGAVGAVGNASALRREAESAGQKSWSEWHGEHGKFVTLRDSLGAEADKVTAQLEAAEAEHKRVRASVGALSSEERRLDKEADKAKELVTATKARADEAVARTREALQRLSAQVTLPGIADAAAGTAAADLLTLCTSSGAPDDAGVERLVTAVQQVLDRKGPAVDENGLMRSLRAVGGNLANTFDLTPTSDEGMWLVDLTDAVGRQPVAVAAARLREQAAGAAAALTDREHRVFTDFVIGGVGEELRRRLIQAEGLVRAMNTSLSNIRTSHGIGVRLRWELVEPEDSPIGRIRELVAASVAVRPSEHTDELIRLLKDRVDERFEADANAGYGEHLRAALDYRQWHRVEVSITGPEPRQVRKISRRAKLSQGETRFVSYVALFAAADAYLSGLPDTGSALRLILLDDAFAKVDDRTIAELMGLLVRMDVDFCMTGHALWGAYPQVPSVDVYEIRRAEGTAAAATHVHWDGRNRHYLRSTG
ncbi:TIGR02680 family protein [Lentzea sp.]|uniref:TIGR02680 family protein n=1 Tax=Lentzea sp. TaxID=56099 RepID=UPI002ED34A0F